MADTVYRTVLFNTLKQEVTRGYTPDVRSSRRASSGLRLQGVCRNPTCGSYNQKIWVTKGYAPKFNLNRQIHHCFCPGCQKQLKDVCNFGIVDAEVKYQGQVVDDEINRSFSHLKIGTMKTFESEPSDKMVEWSFMELSVTDVRAPLRENLQNMVRLLKEAQLKVRRGLQNLKLIAPKLKAMRNFQLELIQAHYQKGVKIEIELRGKVLEYKRQD